MARLLVHHFIACERVAVSRAGPDNPYTLHGVSYGMAPVAVAPGQYRFDELWLFARYYAPPGRYRVEVDVVWLDGPGGLEGGCANRGREVRLWMWPAVKLPVDEL